MCFRDQAQLRGRSNQKLGPDNEGRAPPHTEWLVAVASCAVVMQKRESVQSFRRPALRLKAYFSEEPWSTWCVHSKLAHRCSQDLHIARRRREMTIGRSTIERDVCDIQETLLWRGE